MIIQPINEAQQQQVCSATTNYISKAGQIYGINIESIPVSFDLKGRAAGIYRVHDKHRVIRYNPYIFAKYFSNNLKTTVPHEVAHYITDIIYGLRNIKPHGAEWRETMRALGAEPQVTANYDLTGVPLRQVKRYVYRCDCSTHNLSSIRHNRVLHGGAIYYCRNCSKQINPE